MKTSFGKPAERIRNSLGRKARFTKVEGVKLKALSNNGDMVGVRVEINLRVSATGSPEDSPL